jgi:hypothetical protein
MEMQPYMLTYSAAIAAVSPLATLYQLLKLNPQISISTMRMVTLSAVMFPVQTILKQTQMNTMSPVKEKCNVWAAFGVMGECKKVTPMNCLSAIY